MKKIRFAFIEAMVIEHGSIQRGHLCRAFEVAAPTATKIFRAYKDAHPENLTFNEVSKSYQKSVTFKQENLTLEAAFFLRSAQAMSVETIIEVKGSD